MELKTEQEHFRELTDALSHAASIAQSGPARPFVVHSNFTITHFREQIQRAVVAAAALNFYRNQRGWGQMAALLDIIAKIPSHVPQDWPRIAEHLHSLHDKVKTLENKRLN